MMSITFQFIHVVLFVTMFLAMTTFSKAQEQTTQVVEITNSKLSAINMGLDSTQHWINKMKQGDAKRAATLIADLEKLATRFNRIPASEDDQYKFVVNRFATITAAIHAKAAAQPPATDSTATTNSAKTNNPPQDKPNPKIFAVIKQIENLEASIAESDPANDHQMRQLNKMLAYANRLFSSIPESGQADYKTAKQRLEAVSERIGSVVPQMSSTAGPGEFLSLMRSKYLNDLKLPRAQRMMSSRELTNQELADFLGAVQNFKADIETDLPNIRAASIETGTHSDLVAWVGKESQEFIEQENQKLTEKLDRYVETALSDAANLAGLDPEKNKYTFVTESVRRNNEDKFARALRTLEHARSLEEAFQLPDRWSSRKADLEAYIATYREKAGQAATVSELPQDIGDPSLAKIAIQTLAVKKYGVGKIERLIVNSKIVPRDRIQTRYFNGALETEVREWDEYQVCTVEKENGKFIVYFNTLKKFSRAPQTTPVDQWILSHRYKSGTIAADKLN